MNTTYYRVIYAEKTLFYNHEKSSSSPAVGPKMLKFHRGVPFMMYTKDKKGFF